MQSSKRPVNCIPCAIRKVRCDKRRPCSHCRRRIGDVCVYPGELTDKSAGRPENYYDRIDKLEAYVRRLGGDPQLAEQLGTNNASTANHGVGEPASLGRSGLEAARTERTDELNDTQPGLVEHDEQVTYIEAPMWYSWSGTMKSEEELPQPPLHHLNMPKPKANSLHCFPVLLDPIEIQNNDSLLTLHPSATEIQYLWKKFLENVHPLVMIFFDWEVEDIVGKASQDPSRLSRGEQALVFAICLISTLSLSEEECLDALQHEMPQLLNRFQRTVEDSLLVAEFLVTSDRLVLQAFILYLLVMRNRARPAAIFALTGIASRIAERMGLQRDGDNLGLPVLRSEERRRIWWQLQHMETIIAQLTGSHTLTVYAAWDTKLPANIEDHDLSPNIQFLPPNRRGLTTMSHCLWRYQLLHRQRTVPNSNGSKKGWLYLLSPEVSIREKDASIDTIEMALGEQFLRHCEPLNPLHVHIQISVRGLILMARRLARQPALINAKISRMSPHEREDLLRICVKCLDYYILSGTTESLRRYKWHNENYFQWTGFVYVILEAHHRFDDASVEELWSLISKVYAIHPQLMTATQRPDIASIARITLVAWQKRHAHTQARDKRRATVVEAMDEAEPPLWIVELRRNFDLADVGVTEAAEAVSGEPGAHADQFLPPDFDFDTMDWSFWADAQLDTVLYE